MFPYYIRAHGGQPHILVNIFEARSVDLSMLEKSNRLPVCLPASVLCRGPGKIVDGVFLGRPQSFRHQRRPVDDCSPGRRGMSQNGRTRGGTFHGKIDRCRENQGWTTACSGMPQRDGMYQGEDSPKQAGSCWFARPC